MRKREIAFWFVADAVVAVGCGMFICGLYSQAWVHHHRGVAKEKALDWFQGLFLAPYG